MDMTLESYDTGTQELHVRCDGVSGWKLASRLASLAMAANACGLQSIKVIKGGSGPVDITVRELIKRNPIFKVARPSLSEKSEESPGYYLITQDAGFFCLRSSPNSSRYSIFLSTSVKDMELASKITYLIAYIVGFSSSLSFEVRYSVYELLTDFAEPDLLSKERPWIHMSLEIDGDKLLVSVVDKEVKFIPERKNNFKVGQFIELDKLDRLGLVFEQKPLGAHGLRGDSRNNKVFFEKKFVTSRAGGKTDEENNMKQFKITESKSESGGVYRIDLEGDLDSKGALVLEDLMARLLESDSMNIELNFEKVPFLSSAGVGVLLGMVSSMRSEGGDVVFIGVSPKLKAVFKLLNLDDYFHFDESRNLSSKG